MLAASPVVAEVARAAWAFLASAVGYLVKDVGIRQFLNIGTGLPAANNTHEVAQRAAPESRIVTHLAPPCWRRRRDVVNTPLVTSNFAPISTH